MLLQSAYNYQERGMRTLLFSPTIDTRSGGKISSRIGLDAEALPVQPETNLYKEIETEIQKTPVHCVLVDEAQFLSKEHIFQLSKVTTDLSVPVLTYGLRTDFQGEPFPGSKYLLAWADVLCEIKTVCHCGAKATMNVRIDEQGNVVKEGEQIEIGGNDRYVSTCRKHFYAGLIQSH